MPDGGGRGFEMRTVLALNAGADALGFATGTFGRAARVLRLDEYGPDVLCTAPGVAGVADMRMMLPRPVAYAGSEHGLSAVLAGLLPARVLVAHSVRHAARLEALQRMAGFDAACIAAAIDEEEARDALTPLAPLPELGIAGLEGVRFFGNETGRRALDRTLAAIDAGRRRRCQIDEHVYDVADLVLSGGFYPTERHREWAWAWTGPETIATLLVPGHGAGRARFTLFFFAAKVGLQRDRLRLLVDGQEARCAYYPDENKVEAEAPCADGLCTRLDLVQTEMVATDDHSRFIGLALHKLKLELAR